MFKYTDEQQLVTLYSLYSVTAQSMHETFITMKLFGKHRSRNPS